MVSLEILCIFIESLKSCGEHGWYVVADAISSALTANVPDLGFSLNSDNLTTSGDLCAGVQEILQLFTPFYKLLDTICYVH